MPLRPEWTIPLRALAGWAGAVAAGIVAFDLARSGAPLVPDGIAWSVLAPARPPFQCVVVGAVAAIVLALVRARRETWCVVVASVWIALQIGGAIDSGWPRAVARPLWAAAIVVGLFAAALVYDELARAGYRFGKFLVIGPALSLLWVAATPAAMIGMESTARLVPEILLNAFLGLVIGDGFALGVELVELALGRDDALGSDATA